MGRNDLMLVPKNEMAMYLQRHDRSLFVDDEYGGNCYEGASSICSRGGYLDREGNGVLTYHGGSSNCILVRENIGAGGVVRVAEETMGEGLREHRLWYSTKFDQNAIMPLQRDGDVVKLIKGNDEFLYMNVVEKEGLIQKSAQENTVLGKKKDKRKAELQKWENGVSYKVEKKLKRKLEGAESVIDVQLYTKGSNEYRVQLSNSRCLVVNLTNRTCSCLWWQIHGFLYRHSMAVIRQEKKWVYDYVSACYKGQTQASCYINILHPIETHDMAFVDDRMGCVIGGEALYNDYRQHILPPINPHK
ncbi:hypothetical protein Cgig2_002087 [Carnegiea gigantea]|uniref:SWIM-type domain-containing protein n=1 Tax=Carnegiea gigantea TaxID=171969 RepID=A0A9Q1GNC0_9CARY|nr:hypothetical protein Cgig2_002087 [Carnegiea gigantea]